MAIHLDYDSTCGILRAQATGQFDGDEYREALAQITSGEQYPPTVPTIWDLRDFDFVSFDSRLVRNVQEILSSFESRKTSKVAFVVSSQVGYGMARMLQVLSGMQEDSLVCYEYDEAERWIRNVA